MLPALLAIVLGAVRLFGIAALGRALLRRRRAPWLTLPLALLAGGAGLGVVYGVLLWLGWRNVAIAADMLAMVLAVAFRGRQTMLELRRLFDPLLELVRRSRSRMAGAITIIAIYAFDAVQPVRETDALRYHLAHIAQIDREGRWAAIPIAHYAFPFAWQSTFLPFVHAGIPEAAQVVNLGLWLVSIAAIVAHRGAARIGTTGALILAAIALSPLAVGTATTPTADAFTVVSALVVALILAGRTPDVSGAGFGEATALGFAAWVGVGTRYQAFAIGIAATITAVIWLAHSDRWVTLLGFIEGAVLALLLAAPFFLANAVRFGNPVWPLRSIASGADYATVVGAFYTRSWHGALSPGYVAHAAGQLLVDRAAAPLALLLAAAVIVTLLARGPMAEGSRRVTLFIALFFASWALAQPMLYPRFMVYLVGPALVLALRHAELLERGRQRLLARAILGAGVIAMGAYALAGVALDARALGNGGRERLRASTWYYPVYTWVRLHTPDDAHVLVITRSQETFYLDRFYRRADPGASAEIEWPRVQDGEALSATLARRGFDYVVYDSAAWSGMPGGDEMTRSISDATRRGTLTEVQRFKLTLTRSRFRDAAVPATVIVYRVSGTSAGAAERTSP
ncbi:MAG: hypothetical protein ACJ79K_01415 [Gemmatimonadaceae bacterium]